jgi:hypothetical protein
MKPVVVLAHTRAVKHDYSNRIVQVEMAGGNVIEGCYVELIVCLKEGESTEAWTRVAPNSSYRFERVKITIERLSEGEAP